ncbi:hypothetical protein [Streptomyces sp. NPDC052225]|uniref:hypothetical protein n=1 Tax=Streptomyces sp. NPDC052225 TaxID=3154949 RepID=UPI0034297437
MSNDHARLKQALSRFDTIAWFGAPSQRHPLYGYLQVPFVRWRFSNPQESWKGAFSSVVRDAPSDTEWTFKVAKNWMIVPTRLVTESGPEGHLFSEAVLSISRDDEEFCAKAQTDMTRIIGALEQCVRE